MEGPPLGPGGEDITLPDQVALRGRKASSTRKIKPQTSNLNCPSNYRASTLADSGLGILSQWCIRPVSVATCALVLSRIAAMRPTQEDICNQIHPMGHLDKGPPPKQSVPDPVGQQVHTGPKKASQVWLAG